MGLLMISETINDICKVSHSFSNEEKEFIVQFAFKTSDKELTNKLIDELVESVDETDSIRTQYFRKSCYRFLLLDTIHLNRN